MLALLPPHLWGRAKAAASYAGLIPEREESGKSVERNRRSRKGPPLLRRKLYMGALDPLTRPLGLSLGDRACLAARKVRGLAVLTADRIWAGVDLGVPVKVVRP